MGALRKQGQVCCSNTHFHSVPYRTRVEMYIQVSLMALHRKERIIRLLLHQSTFYYYYYYYYYYSLNYFIIIIIIIANFRQLKLLPSTDKNV